MTYQSESALEAELVQLLTSLNYKYTQITNEQDLLSNLKSQLEFLNQTSLTPEEFNQVKRYLSSGTIFEKANKLRGYIDIKSENQPTKYIKLLNQEDYTKNTFQITQQVKVQGKYQNRYDITLLINGLPLVQIELKRRGLELKEAFNQINRYQRDSYGASAGLFHYIQIFIISNGVNTKYFANNKDQSFKQTFYWTDDKNNKLSDIKDFSRSFLEPNHISKMICRYIVLTTKSTLMILRPYQIYAVEAIIHRVKTSKENGYIWHTTGSGKTLTSFKTAQILVQFPEIDKVIFVVDRKDLDSQTSREFNAFSAGCVDVTKNTKFLVDQLLGKTAGGAMKDKLVITTIQKLNNAFSNYKTQLEVIKNQRIIFIFDECHRSQFGDIHKNIVKYFKDDHDQSNIQMIGFTGTPIFEENAMSGQGGKQTTAHIFKDRLHEYVIVDAINDQNVLPFNIEYVGRYQIKDSATELDIEVNGDIDKKEVLESDARIEKIVDYVLKVNGQKTYNQEFSAIMALSSIDVLYKYYQVFKQKNKQLKICAIFSYLPNEEDPNANGIQDGDDQEKLDQQAVVVGRDKLETIIADYNTLYGTSFTTKDQQGFYQYFEDISSRLKLRDIDKSGQKKDQYIDILLVVNMFLTGFDSPTLNTIYVDKNLKYHGLIQAFSRTNRILNEKKHHGQVISFRNLKDATDKAISLFANPQAKDIILIKPYGEYTSKINELIQKLLSLCATPNQVDHLRGEEDKLKFINIFRELLKAKNIIAGFVDFKWQDLQIQEQDFEDFKSKYLDLYESLKKPSTDKESILKDIDFVIELIHRDEINVSYILKLIDDYLNRKNREQQERQYILNLLNNEPKLRNKKELILKFIDELLVQQGNQGLVIDDIQDAFFSFIEQQRAEALHQFCTIRELDTTKITRIVSTFLHDGIPPSMKDIQLAYHGAIVPDIYLNKIVSLRHELLDWIDQYYGSIQEIG